MTCPFACKEPQACAAPQCKWTSPRGMRSCQPTSLGESGSQAICDSIALVRLLPICSWRLRLHTASVRSRDAKARCIPAKQVCDISEQVCMSRLQYQASTGDQADSVIASRHQQLLVSRSKTLAGLEKHPSQSWRLAMRTCMDEHLE